MSQIFGRLFNIAVVDEIGSVIIVAVVIVVITIGTTGTVFGAINLVVSVTIAMIVVPVVIDASEPIINVAVH